MFKAILFDLDGTLLDLEMETFLQHYFKRMALMANEYGPMDGKKLIDQVWKSTAVMIGNRDPRFSNEEVFMSDFFSSGDFPREHTREFFNDFYDLTFPALKNLCSPYPRVLKVMEKVFANQLKVVIATNAVFPLKAIQHRLDWAGVGNFPYDLVTSYEVMHYCKPHPEYYQEISHIIGVPPHQCLMVGNDQGEDLPAGMIGMKTYLVEDGLIERGADFVPDWKGTFAQFERFLESVLES